MRTVGLLGGMSWQSTQIYYKLINENVQARKGGLHSAPLLIKSFDFAEIETLQASGQWADAGRLLEEKAVALQAAGAEGRTIDEQLLRQGITPHLTAELVVVEGAGGLFSPLGPGTLNHQLARDLGLPLVVVDAARIGLIGRTLATVTAAKAVGLTVAAVVISAIAADDLSRPADQPDHPAAIAAASLADLRQRLPELPIGWLGHRANRITPTIDWRSLAAPVGQR